MSVDPTSRKAPFPGGIKRIAVEEAFVTREIVDRWRRTLESNSGDIEPGFKALMGFFLFADTPFTTSVVERLKDLGEKRIGDMDVAGIDMQVLSLTSPGVHVFDPDTATALAADSNDQLAEAIARHPDRFAGLAVVAPQDPAAAAREIERGFNGLGLRGVMINSHVNGDYLHDQKYWEIFEAAEAMDAPVYIHPNTPSAGMLDPYLPELYGAILGFAAGHRAAPPAPDPVRPVRPVPEPDHCGRPPGRGPPLLDVPIRFRPPGNRSKRRTRLP